MFAFLAPLLLRLGPARAFLKRNGAAVVFILLALVLVGSALFLYQRGHSAGQKEVEVRVERQHTETIREVRTDEQLAQHITDAVDARLAAAQTQQRAETAATTKEITDAFAALPAPAPGAVACVVPDSVRDASNRLVDRANRAADDPVAAQ